MSELILRIALILLLWLCALLFLKHVTGNLILGFWDLIMKLLCNIPWIKNKLSILQPKTSFTFQPFKEASDNRKTKNQPPLNINIYPNSINSLLGYFIPFKKWCDCWIFCYFKDEGRQKYSHKPTKEMVNSPINKRSNILSHSAQSTTGENDESTTSKQNQVNHQNEVKR